MAQSTLTGSRIRQRRMVVGVKQADLAQAVGISPSYLNLIEHNRRRIGGKLVVDIARHLEVDAAALTEGAEGAVVEALRQAAASKLSATPEVDRIEDFAGRLPGWAGLVAAQQTRIGELERTVETLTDRLTHDPHLATSLHEMVSTVTAIRSTASILNETQDLEPEWRTRFQRNVHEDSLRLAETSTALVAYLDAAADVKRSVSSPQDELEAYLEAQGHHIPGLEEGAGAQIEDLIAAAPALTSTPAKGLARTHLTRYHADARAMPLGAFVQEAEDVRFQPDLLAKRFGVDLAAVLRRISTLPRRQGEGHAGLVICDGSGTLTLRRAVEGFPLPRFGAACPIWPLYQALARPMTPQRAVVTQAGAEGHRFLTYAIAQPAYPAGFAGPQVFEATMLILPADMAAQDLEAAADAYEIGSSCRVCPKADCPARREPSILAEGM